MKMVFSSSMKQGAESLPEFVNIQAVNTTIIEALWEISSMEGFVAPAPIKPVKKPQPIKTQDLAAVEKQELEMKNLWGKP
jgi:hypothetical protein